MPKQSLEFSGHVDAATVAEYLEALANGLRLGEISLESGPENVILAVSGNLTLELEARSNPDKGRSSIDLRLEWRRRTRSREPAQALTINADRSSPLTESDETQQRTTTQTASENEPVRE